MHRLLSLFAAFVPLSALSAQDLIGVGWSGSLWAIDSNTGVGTNVGMGLPGQNALATDDQGRLWSTTRNNATPYVYGLSIVDPVTNSATEIHSATGLDFRGLASTGTSQLWGIRDGSPDSLMLLDTATGTATLVGPTGRSQIQALARHQGTLYAWDLSVGLMTVDTTTGATTDVSAAVGGAVSSGTVQFLCSHGDGRLLGGGTSLYSIDVTTGAATLIGLIAAGADIRGCEQIGGSFQTFGRACAGPFGPTTLVGSGNPAINNTIVLTSRQHSNSALGVQILGLSNTVHQGLPLPIALGPVAGFPNCFLNVSIDATFIGFTGTSTPDLVFSLFLPPIAAGMIFHVQHAVFDAVPGGTSWTNGLTVRVAQ